MAVPHQLGAGVGTAEPGLTAMGHLDFRRRVAHAA
jgi:hypothetical protein